MVSHSKWLLFLLCIVASPIAVPGTLDFHLRAVPASPTAGQPFVVQADSLECARLFTADPIGSGQVYSQVTTSPGVVVAQVGYEIGLIPPCNYPQNTVSLAVPGLAAGTYRIELRGRHLFAPAGSTDLLQQITVVVGPGEPATIPAMGLGALLLLIAAVSVGVLFARGESAAS